jgi:hypothetical protein
VESIHPFAAPGALGEAKINERPSPCVVIRVIGRGSE